MAHYPQQFSTDGLQGSGLELMRAIKRQVMTDWAEDLAEYPEWVVAEACRQWRRAVQGKFRPSISEFRQLCDVLLAPIRLKKYEAERVLAIARRKAEDETYFESERRKRFKLDDSHAA